jgi:hypothetical protein
LCAGAELAGGVGAEPLEGGAGVDGAVVVDVATCVVVAGGAGVVLVSVAAVEVLVVCDVVLIVVVVVVVVLAAVVVAEPRVPGSAAVAAAADPGACSGIAHAISAAIVVAVDRETSIWSQKTCGGVQTFPDSGLHRDHDVQPRGPPLAERDEPTASVDAVLTGCGDVPELAVTPGSASAPRAYEPSLGPT